jgi:hypothetical protein
MSRLQMAISSVAMILLAALPYIVGSLAGDIPILRRLPEDTAGDLSWLVFGLVVAIGAVGVIRAWYVDDRLGMVAPAAFVVSAGSVLGGELSAGSHSPETGLGRLLGSILAVCLAVVGIYAGRLTTRLARTSEVARREAGEPLGLGGDS